PLWIAGLVESQHEPLFEIPVIQPKDTWFGPNAQQGEICYAIFIKKSQCTPQCTNYLLLGYFTEFSCHAG
ncbi:hypothetical protein KN396_17280, partial [Acinetobacter baumannii]|nr:hypothetical protein [Acinetobacter baumannii]